MGSTEAASGTAPGDLLGPPAGTRSACRTGRHAASQLTRRGAEADSKPDTHLLSPMRSPRGLDVSRCDLTSQGSPPTRRANGFESSAKPRCLPSPRTAAGALPPAGPSRLSLPRKGQTAPPLGSARSGSGVTRSSEEKRANAIAPFFTARSGPLRRASRSRAATADLPFEPAGHRPEWCRAAAP